MGIKIPNTEGDSTSNVVLNSIQVLEQHLHVEFSQNCGLTIGMQCNGKPQQHQLRPAKASENSAMIELALGALGPVSRRLQTGHGVMPGMIHHRLVSPDLLLIIIIQFVCPATSHGGVQPTFVLRPPLFAQCNPVAVLQLVINQLVWRGTRN